MFLAGIFPSYESSPDAKFSLSSVGTRENYMPAARLSQYQAGVEYVVS
jgi:hypothetical protein